MKRHIIAIGYTLCLLAVFLISCNDDRNLVSTGVLYLNVDEDATLLTKVETGVTYESLRVDILQGEDTIKSYSDYLTEIKGERLILPVGMYTVAVRSNNISNAGWETPFYQGKEDIEVKQGEITNAKIVCKIANTKVSVEYGKSVKEHFIDYRTVVSTSLDSLTFTRDEYRSGYFTAEKLTVKLKLVNNDGNEFTIKKVYPDILPQYHYVFKFTLKDGDGDTESGVDFDITVDKDNKEITYDIFIKEEDELFGKGAPELSLGGTFEDNLITFRKKEEAVIPEASLKLSVPNGIRSLNLKTSSWQFGNSVFDQTNWPKDFPTINLQEVEQTIDFTSLIEYLQPEELSTALHKFTLTVSDNLYQEEEITFSFEIKANVPVNFGTPVVWAKFAVLAGESDNLDNVSFLFREKGKEDYQRIEEDNIVKNEEAGTFTALIQNLKPGTTYEYKAVSDGEETKLWKDIPTESTPTGVNMGFEDWCTVDGLPRPWKSDETTPFWSCGNSSVIGVKAIMTESSSDNYQGEDGDGGSTAVYMNSMEKAGKFAAGNIFTGDFELKSLNGVLTLGRKFSGRPFQLVGFYKYLPATVGNGGSQISNGSTDLCSIYIALTDEKMTIHTGEKRYFDPSNKAIIAYGELPIEESGKKVDVYKRFVIDLEYRDLNRKPKYIIIVASSSKYGDYFQGGVGSKMWMDALQLIYPNSMSDIKLKQ